MVPDILVIHHSLTEDSNTVSWNAIRRYHTETLGWSDIGYHFGIEYIRDHYEILMGRMPNVKGAHCLGHNNNSIGICFVGCFDTHAPSQTQLYAGARLATWICKVYHIPVSNIVGHRDLIGGSKTCPGKAFDLDLFRSLVEQKHL